MKRTIYLILVAVALLLALGFVFWLLGGAIAGGPSETPAGEQTQQDAQLPAEETEKETEPTEFAGEEAPVITFPSEASVPSETEAQTQGPAQATEAEEPQTPETQATEPTAATEPDSTESSFISEGSGDENELPPIPFELG